MDVVTSGTIGENVESLSKSELFASIHAEISSHKDDNAALDRAILDVRAHVGIVNFIEGHRLDFFGDLFESRMFGTGVGHLAAVLVEVDESLSLFSVELHGLVVLVEEHIGNTLGIHLLPQY